MLCALTAALAPGHGGDGSDLLKGTYLGLYIKGTNQFGFELQFDDWLLSWCQTLTFSFCVVDRSTCALKQFCYGHSETCFSKF